MPATPRDAHFPIEQSGAAVGVYVRALNGCAYCVDHHDHYGGKAFEGGAGEWRTIVDALHDESIEDAFDGKHLAMLRYAAAVTLDPALVTEQTIRGLRDAGAQTKKVPGKPRSSAADNFSAGTSEGEADPKT